MDGMAKIVHLKVSFTVRRVHGGKFDVATGRVISPHPKISIPAYEVMVEGEDISVRLVHKIR